MKLIDIVRLAALNLWRRRLRTVLTILGVIIGTACIMVMIAMGIGNMEQFDENFMKNADLTQINVYNEGERNASSSNMLNDKAIATFKQIPNVSAATGVLQLYLFIRIGKYETYTDVNAVEPAFIENMELYKGTVFRNESMPTLVFGGDQMARFREKGDTEEPMYGFDGEKNEEAKLPDIDWLNENVEIWFGGNPDEQNNINAQGNKGMDTHESSEEQPKPKMFKGKILVYTEPGQMNEKSFTSYMSLEIAKNWVRENRKLAENYGIKMNTYNTALIKAKDVDSVQGILDVLIEQGYQANSQSEWIKQFKDEQARRQDQLLFIALISLLVSAIGIANTMLTTIMERKAEIGVMKVIGMGINKINLLFLTESAMIGLTGGILGTLAGYIVSFIMNSNPGEAATMGANFGQSVRLVIPLWLNFAAAGIATCVGVLSGIYPSWKATKLSPLEAIRGLN